ncbi:MAG: hypothetical protein K2Q10_01045 [Rhodospirillales bacterium]|nr:hypothetical protein [Rhodospirillales bacterium]
MKKNLEARLQELKREFEVGTNNLAAIEAQRTSLRETLLRISGAVQVLEEELAREREAALSPQEVG